MRWKEIIIGHRLYLILLLAWNDCVIRFQSRVGLMFVVIVPLAMTAITGFAFKGFEPRSIEPKVALEDNDHGPVAARFRELMEHWPASPQGKTRAHFITEPIDPAEARRQIAEKELTGLLVLPEGMSRMLEKGEDVQLVLWVGPSQTVDRSVAEGTVDRLVQRVKSQNPLPLEWKAEEETKGHAVLEGFSSFTQAVAGNGVMFILLNCIVMGGMTIVREKRQNTLDRLLISPLRPGMIVLGKAFGVFIVGVVQAIVIFAFGVLMPGGVKFEGVSVFGVVLVTLFFILVGCAIGLMISALARREENVESVGVPTALLLTALGGGMFPVEMGPAWMQKIVLFLPTGWAMQGYHKLMWEGLPWPTVIPDLIVLAAFSLVFFAIGVRYLRWD